MALPNSHKRILVNVYFLVPLLELAVKITGLKNTVRCLRVFASKKTKPDGDPRKLINQHSNFLNLYSKHFPFWGKCLAKSLALWFLLANRGIKTDLRFGMKKENGMLRAHAWLEFEGIPLATETEIQENYSFFSESILSQLLK